MIPTIRTTITLPQDLLEAAKIAAVHRKSNVSELIRIGLHQVLTDQSRLPKKSGLSLFVGRGKVGTKGVKREAIYGNYLRKKMSS